MINEENYVSEAEKVILSIKDDKYKKITTSQIRNLLTLVNEVYAIVKRIQGDTLDSETVSRVQYIKMRFAYAAGRDEKTKGFINASKLFVYLGEVGNDKKKFVMVARYMEALVAYHKYYIGG